MKESWRHLNLFNHEFFIITYGWNFDSIPIISVILFAVGLVGVMVYERARSRTKEAEESTS